MRKQHELYEWINIADLAVLSFLLVIDSGNNLRRTWLINWIVSMYTMYTGCVSYVCQQRGDASTTTPLHAPSTIRKNTQSTTLIEIQVSNWGYGRSKSFASPLNIINVLKRFIHVCHSMVQSMSATVCDVWFSARCCLQTYITIASCITKKNTDENEFKIPYASSTNYPLSFLLLHTQSNWILNFFSFFPLRMNFMKTIHVGESNVFIENSSMSKYKYGEGFEWFDYISIVHFMCNVFSMLIIGGDGGEIKTTRKLFSLDRILFTEST